jgi:hypothetical protein
VPESNRVQRRAIDGSGSVNRRKLFNGRKSGA